MTEGMTTEFKHGNIRFDGVPHGIGHLEHGPIHIQDADDSAVILHADQNLTTSGICEGDDGLLDVVRILPFEFCGHSFRHSNSPRTDDTTIICVLTTNVKKNDLNRLE